MLSTRFEKKMRISVPRGTFVGAVQAQQDPPGPPAGTADEPPLASDEEWVTDSESDTETDPAAVPQQTPQVRVMERNGMGAMVRMQNSGVHADYY